MSAAAFVLLLALAAPGAAAQELSPAEQERVAEDATVEEAEEIETEGAALRQRLRAIFGAVDEFEGLRAHVEAGIVVLSGTAPSRDAVDRAAATAERLEGVLLVVDDVEVARSLGRRLAEARGEAVRQLREMVASLPLLVAAILILAIAWLVARLLRDARFLYRFASKRELLQNLLRQTVFVAVLLAGLVAALRFLEAGALIGTVLGAAGVVGLAHGFAFRNIVENYLAGVRLAVRQPFRARDLVSIDGSEATVLRMTASETILMDMDGNHLRIPNALIFNGKVMNYTRNPLRRFQVAVSVATDVDLDQAQQVAVGTLRRMNGVIGDPAPSALIAALGDSTVQLDVFGWVDQRAASHLKVASEAHRLVKEAFDEAGIEMPAPSYRVAVDGARAELAPAEPEPRPRPRPAQRGQAPEAIDVSPKTDIAEQVEAEIATSQEENLLDEA